MRRKMRNMKAETASAQARKLDREAPAPKDVNEIACRREGEGT